MKRKIVRHLVALLGVFALGTASYGQTVVKEMVIQDESTWSLSGSPYLIEGNISIHDSGSLLIESGCVLIFEGNYGIDVAGSLTLSGWAQTIRIQGRDLGNGKHILWQGMRAISQKARIALIQCDIQDAEVAVDFSGTTYEVTGPELYSTVTTFSNNITALKTGKQGSIFTLGECSFVNNDVAILGNYSQIDTGSSIYRQLTIYGSTFEGNQTAIQSAYCHITACKFTNNTTAIEDALYSQIDSTGFERNKLAIRGYGLTIERCIFFLNDKAIIHSGRDLQRDKMMRNSTIRSNNFESNKEAVFIEDGAMLSELGCNLFYKNDIALVLPDSLNNWQNAAIHVERNVFLQNNMAIQVLELEGTASPDPGTGLQPVSFLYNALAINFIIIDHTSPNNLNFLHNYILAPNKAIIEFGIVEGNEKPIPAGLVNYTVSGDTSSSGGLIVVNKIEDVIKHQNYDDSLFSGNTYQFEACESMPGYVLAIEAKEAAPQISVYPNPFTNQLHIEWAEEMAFDFVLYNITGQEIQLARAKGLSSPAQFDLSFLEAGIYFLRIKSEFGVQSIKLIKH